VAYQNTNNMESKKKNVAIDAKLHKAAKMEAARQGVTLSEFVERQFRYPLPVAAAITRMHTGEKNILDFGTWYEAVQYFAKFCDDNNIPYEHGETEAGGIGYDYRIEIL
jgi:hypothetical protein